MHAEELGGAEGVSEVLVFLRVLVWRLFTPVCALRERRSSCALCDFYIVHTRMKWTQRS